MKNAGLISMGAYLPAKPLAANKAKLFATFLERNTLLHPEYIEVIRNNGCMPGTVETNYDGWECKPWFEAWLNNLPEKKRANPFQGTSERRRVPMDPVSVRESMVPHPMLPSDAETLAGAMAIFNAGISKDDIDLVMVHSQVRDFSLPANVSLVQHKLRLPEAGAYGVDTCCSSFVTMMELASSLVMTGIKKNVLIISSILDSMINDKSDYYSVNTGDAAVAGIVAAVEQACGYRGSYSVSEGSRHDGIIFQRRPPHLLRTPGTGASFAQEFVTFYNPLAAREIAVHSQDDMKHAVGKVLKKTGLSIPDIDLFVTHQPVAWAANAWREAVGVPEEKFYESFTKYGNIATCSAAVNLLEALEAGMAKPGDTLLIASSGAGENYIALVENLAPELIRSLT